MKCGCHLEVSLYCTAPKRIPVALTELAKGLMIPAMKPFTCRKLAWPMLEEPSTRKTMSAACTLLHLPANTPGEGESESARREITGGSRLLAR